MTSSAIGDESKFLRDAPAEIRDVLDWDDAGQTQRAPTKMTEFAGNFLGAMCEDGAAIPETLVGSAPRRLALVLLHHLRNPESAGAWLNLGLALRRMALYRTQDSEQLTNDVCTALWRLWNALCNWSLTTTAKTSERGLVRL